MISNPPKLTLVGTVHRDQHGHQHLSTLLEQLQPHLLTLEMSPYALHYRQTRGRQQLLRLERILERLAAETGRPVQELKTCQAIRDIFKLLALPYEYCAARDFADRRGCRLELVDVAEVSALKLKRVETGLITYHNLKVLIALPEQEASQCQESYGTAQTLLLNDPAASICAAFLRQRRGTEGVGPRDRAMAEQIRRLLQGGSGHLVHVGGWVHLLTDPLGETLFSRLGEYAPVRRLLVETGPRLAQLAGS